MRNVAGLSTSEAQKSSDLFMKCRYLDELTGGKGIVFATGTPVSNSMTELYTMQKYLQYDTLQSYKLMHFGSWAAMFGETAVVAELSPQGSGYCTRTRFSRFNNLPELMCMFKEAADIKTADMLNLPRPEAHFHTVVAQPSEIQKDMMKDLSDRAAAVHAGVVESTIDNMLKVTTDGRKIGLDQRLMNDMLPDFDGSKVNLCAQNMFRIWQETAENRLTQLAFCDFSTPNSDGRFNVYSDIREKLLNNGVQAEDIAFIHEYDTEIKKKELFAKVRSGKIRILFGSTQKLGAGTNVQDKLIALHDLDCPWRPADLEQRAGRILRRGNTNPVVDIYRYVTESTFDSYLYQTIENKQKFISQIMTSKSPMRSCEDIDESVLSYAEIKALCAGDSRIKEKMELDIEVAKLKLLKSDYLNQHYRLEDELLRGFPDKIKHAQSCITRFEKDMELLKSAAKPNEHGFSPMEIHGRVYADKSDAGDALLKTLTKVQTINPTQIGRYCGFTMSVAFDSLQKMYKLYLEGNMTYKTDLGNDVFGNITRMNNALGEMEPRLNSAKRNLDNLYQQQESAKIEVEIPFQFEQELAEKSEHLAFLDAELNIDGGKQEHVIMDDDDENADEIDEVPEVEAAKSKPSILADLNDKVEKIKSQIINVKTRNAEACL